MTKKVTFNPQAVIIVGMDLGTTGAKAAAITAEGLKTFMTEAILAPASGKLGEAGRELIGKLTGKSPVGDMPDLVEYQGSRTWVGKGTHRKPNAYQPVAQNRLTDGAAMLKLILNTLAKFNFPAKQKIKLELSLPVHFINDDDGTLQSEIQGWLVGTHRFSVNGQPYEYEVVDFDYNHQPTHAYIGMTRDINFKWVHPVIDEAKPVIIIDQGGGTLDTALIDIERIDGEYVPNLNMDYTKGGEAGFFRAAEMLGRELAEDYNANYSSYELCNALELYANGEIPEIFVNGLTMPIANQARQAFNFMADDALELSRRIVPGAKAKNYAVFLIGGPANLKTFEKKFRTEYKNLMVNGDRFLAARGALIFRTYMEA